MNPRVVLVTGAVRGIGTATVRRLAADGQRVLAVDGCEDATAGLPYPSPRVDPDAVMAATLGGSVVHTDRSFSA